MVVASRQPVDDRPPSSVTVDPNDAIRVRDDQGLAREHGASDGACLDPISAGEGLNSCEIAALCPLGAVRPRVREVALADVDATDSRRVIHLVA
jgi:hypothetical protein